MQDVSVAKNKVRGLHWNVQAQGLEVCLRAAVAMAIEVATDKLCRP